MRSRTVSIDKNSRRLIKNLTARFRDGTAQLVADDALSFDIDPGELASFHAEIVIPLRFGTSRKPVVHFLTQGEIVHEIAMAASPARLVVGGHSLPSK